jgi:hypothetical protein
MIRHQHVGVNPAFTFSLSLSKTFQKEEVIIISEKRSLAIVSALDDVMRVRRNGNSR